MKHLYYIRHGESEANIGDLWSGHFDAPLTTKGLEQAKIAGQKVKETGLVFDVIFSSPLQRARDTAREIAAATGYPVDSIILDDDLRERFFGELEGTHHDPKLFGGYWEDEALIDTYTDVEKLAEMKARVQKVLAYLKSRPEDTILITSHGAIGRMLRREIEGQPIDGKVNPYPNAELVKLI